MKIVSEYKELEGQTFDTIEECAKAEAVVDERKVATQKLLDSKKKRALSKVIEDADQQVLDAYANYEKVKKEVQRILEESNNQMTKMLTDAADKIKSAEKTRRDAILEYTKNYGSYQKVYSGERAVKECERLEAQFADSLGDVINAFIAL